MLVNIWFFLAILYSYPKCLAQWFSLKDCRGIFISIHINNVDHDTVLKKQI